jgi:hypothetical protein
MVVSGSLVSHCSVSSRVCYSILGVLYSILEEKSSKKGRRISHRGRREQREKGTADSAD